MQPKSENILQRVSEEKIFYKNMGVHCFGVTGVTGNAALKSDFVRAYILIRYEFNQSL